MVTNRYELAMHFNELGFKTGAEIGVLAGHYSEILCKTNPGLKLFCIDSWGTGEVQMRDYHLRKYENAKVRLAPYNTTLIHKFSMDAVKDFEDNSLDFVYIDANHEADFVRDDINEWSKKVRHSGIVSGHDYDTERVKRVVDDYVKNNNFSLNATILGKDKATSWWFVRL